MLTARKKILKQGEPNLLEDQVAQALFDLEVTNAEIKAELRELQITSAREVDVANGKKAIVVFVPFRNIKGYHKIQSRLIRELEKKFARTVVIIAQRRVLAEPSRKNRIARQKRPRSRTLTAVHDAILEDVVYPTEIVGRRMRVRVDGSRLYKIFLNRRDKDLVEGKLESFASIYKKLTGKDITFDFPVQE